MRSVWVLVVVVVLLLTGCAKKDEGEGARETKTNKYTWFRAACAHPDHGDEPWYSDWLSSEEDAINRRDMHQGDNRMHNPYVDVVYQTK